MNKLYFCSLILVSVVSLSACSNANDADAVSDGNTAPIANAGTDSDVVTSLPVLLDGSGSSDANGDALSYQWTLLAPGASASTLLFPTLVDPSFTPDIDGKYTVSLVVNDGTVDSAVDTVVFIASNSAPIAEAGADRNVITGVLATLDGSASSDPDGSVITYQWAFQSQPAGSSPVLPLFDPTFVNPSFTPDVDGDYTVQLIVNDGIFDSAVDTVTFTAAETASNAPIADAGDDVNVVTGLLVTLDGGGSSDPDDDPIVSYLWAFQSQPVGSSPVLPLFDPTSVNPSFTPDVDGEYTITLVVNDGTFDSVADAVIVTAAAATGSFEAGRIKYDADCGSCHRAGSYDVTANPPSAGDLYNKGELLTVNLSGIAGMAGVADLTAQEIVDLDAFLEDPSIAP